MNPHFTETETEIENLSNLASQRPHRQYALGGLICRSQHVLRRNEKKLYLFGVLQLFSGESFVRKI